MPHSSGSGFAQHREPAEWSKNPLVQPHSKDTQDSQTGPFTVLQKKKRALGKLTCGTEYKRQQGHATRHARLYFNFFQLNPPTSMPSPCSLSPILLYFVPRSAESAQWECGWTDISFTKEERFVTGTRKSHTSLSSVMLHLKQLSPQTMKQTIYLGKEMEH